MCEEMVDFGDIELGAKNGEGLFLCSQAGKVDEVCIVVPMKVNAYVMFTSPICRDLVVVAHA
jgi:hypothetical protein